MTPHRAAPEWLLSEGDWLARRLAQQLAAPLERQERLVLYGRSLAANLLQALPPAAEQLSRRAGKPLHLDIVADERGRAALQAVNADGEPLSLLSADDLLEEALFVRGKLHPAIAAELLEALHGSEHAATRSLVACLKSKPVLQATGRYLQSLLLLA